MKRLLTILLAVCLVAGLVTGLAGCSENTPSGETSKDPASNPGTSATATPDPNAEKYGGTYAGVSNFTAINCYLPTNTVKAHSLLVAPAVESLGRFTEAGEIEWFLVEKCTVSVDPATITFKLREGITFSDGSELTAEVVGWNIDQYNANGRGAIVANCKEYEVTDKYTIVLKWDVYDSCRAETLAQVRIYSQKSYEEKGEQYMQNTPVGTGAFVLDEAVESSYISYVKRDGYWQEGLPYLDKIVLYSMTDENTIISSMTNAEVSGVNTNSGNVQKALESSGFENKASTTAPLIVGMSMFVCTDGNPDSPWADLKVRQAAYYAMDVESIIPSVYAGAQTATRQAAVKGMWHYLEESEMTYVYKYDVEKAKSLLAEAGYPNGFETTFYATSTSQNLAVAAQSYLDQVGIKSEITLLDQSSFNQTTRTTMWDGICFHGGSPISLNPTDWYGRNFGKDGTRTLLKVAGAYHEQILTALEHTAVAFTDEEIKSSGKEFGLALNETCTCLPTSYSIQRYYTQDNVFDYGMYKTSPYDCTPEIAYVLDK